MQHLALQISLLGFTGFFVMTSCQNRSVGHIGATRLVIMQQIPVIESRFDENFRATLDLLLPHQCHDTAFIQEQIFLERIDLEVPFRKEFVIPPKLWRDFFGSNNPDTKKTLREDMFYLGDTCFEKNTDRQFLAESRLGCTSYQQVIGDFLRRNRNALVYFISTDTLQKNYDAGGLHRLVHHDPVKLNCRIVEDLRKKPLEELAGTTVIMILIPPGIPDTLRKQGPVSTRQVQHHRAPVKAGGRLTNAGCPPDSVVHKANEYHRILINEFRNLLHYIATTEDEELKQKYIADADREIHKIPGACIEGIAGSLGEFLNSGFSKHVKVFPLTDKCNVITGIKINDQ